MSHGYFIDLIWNLVRDHPTAAGMVLNCVTAIGALGAAAFGGVQARLTRQLLRHTHRPLLTFVPVPGRDDLVAVVNRGPGVAVGACVYRNKSGEILNQTVYLGELSVGERVDVPSTLRVTFEDDGPIACYYRDVELRWFATRGARVRPLLKLMGNEPLGRVRSWRVPRAVKECCRVETGVGFIGRISRGGLRWRRRRGGRITDDE